MHRFLPANQHQHHKRNKEYNIGNQYNFPKQFLFASRIRLVPVVLYLLLQHPRIRPQRKTHHQPEHLLIVVFPLHGQKQQHNRRGKNRNHQPKFDFPCACRHAALLDNQPMCAHAEAQHAANDVHQRPNKTAFRGMRQQDSAVHDANGSQQHFQHRNNRLLRHISRSFRSSSGDAVIIAHPLDFTSISDRKVRFRV